MSPVTIGVIGIVALIVLIFLGMNIGMALMTVGFFGFAAVTNYRAAFSVLCTVPSTQASTYSMLVIPLFILMGNFAYRARLSDGLFDAAKKWLSRVPGNLACATVAACAGFGAICGSTPATCATMGTIALPQMRKEGYDDRLSTGSIAIGGTLGILIPPSTPMILYAVLTTTSVGAMFAAGVLPGIMVAILCIITIVILCKIRPGYAPPTCSYTWGERFRSLKGLIGVVFLFGVVLGGMFSGYFSVAQASAIGSFLAMLLCIPGKTFNMATILDALKECTRTFAMTFLIMIGASVFSSFLAITTLPVTLATAITGLNVSKYVVLLLITLIYIFLGMIMDALPMMMLTVPIFYPIVTALGFSNIWFGIYIIMVMNFGSISPPVGINCFIINGLSKDISLGTIYRSVVPFIFTMIVAIALIIFFPTIVTCVPTALNL
jgi:tripartite ATP-independent transporter DctM subunit